MRMRNRGWLLRLVALLSVFAVVAAACGSDDESSAETTEGNSTEADTSTPESAEEDDEEGTEDGDEEGTEDEAPAEVGNVVILAEQANEVEEAAAIESQLLSQFAGTAEYIPVESEVAIERTLAEVAAGSGEADALFLLHGIFPTLEAEGALLPLDDLVADAEAVGIPASTLELGRLGTDTQWYIPTVQATFMMVANKQALEFLPEGVDVNALTWEELAEWGRTIESETGAKRIGVGAGQDGLLHRFLEGSLYPSFTGAMTTEFNSPEAVEMWEFFRTFWNDTVNPQATSYTHMQDQLLSEEVWIAYDHQARLIDALNERPDDFIAFPAPTGPEGLGYMPVVGGIGISAAAPNPEGAKELIRLFLSDSGQQVIASNTGFFGVSAVEAPADLPPGAVLQQETVALTTGSADALPALLPVGLGEQSGDINKIYRDTFTRIIINGEDIASVLDDEVQNLQTMFDETGAPCWAPDPASDGPCQVAG